MTMITDNCVLNMDALDLLKQLPDNHVDLILTDPPYMGVKDAEWDNQWATVNDYLDWLRQHLEQFRRVLKPNGSLYLFASPQMAARVEVAVSDYFNVLNRITWSKPRFSTKAEMFDKEMMRGYFPSSEAIIFAEQFAVNEQITFAEYELNGTVFEPLKTWFRTKAKEAGIKNGEFNKRLGFASNGGGIASGVIGEKIEFCMPTLETYTKMQILYPVFNREYDDLRREYDDLRREYEQLRRPFNVTDYMPYTDVWTFRTVQAYPGKHECEKPLPLLKHIITASSLPEALVLDCFCGGGSTLDAASQLGRRYIGSDTDAGYCEIARQRLALPFTLPLFD